MSIGIASIVISLLVLAAWIPLGVRVGVGTILNAIVVGAMIDITLLILPRHPPLGLAAAEVIGAISLVAIGSAVYLGTRLGAGPRDGLMIGLHRRTGRSLRLVRVVLELTVLAAGAALGGTAGVATVLFAVTIGPAVQRALRVPQLVGSSDAGAP